MKQCKIIVGKNFGDEGKGLTTDYFANQFKRQNATALVVKHNGGGQAGHTVEYKNNIRFVFHQLSSGSFCGCPTYLCDTFIPDLLKLEDEIKKFGLICPDIPHIYVDSECKPTLIYDVLVNEIVENMRKNSRHGSCGMGINESVVRNRHKQYSINIAELSHMSVNDIYCFLKKIRKEYIPKRFDELNISLNSKSVWYDILNDNNIPMNCAEIMYDAFQYTDIIEKRENPIKNYDNIIFESAQGLMLDCDNTEFFPHLTPSHTGSKNPFRLMERNNIEYNQSNTEICYVTRTYVTRHGAGFLPNECGSDEINTDMHDITNIPNDWQETMRFARHGSPENFLEYIFRESIFNKSVLTSLFVTHLNETSDCIVTTDGLIPINEYVRKLNKLFNFGNIYLSNGRYSENTHIFGQNNQP